MQFSFKKLIGNTEITFTDIANNHKEFFEKVSFYSQLPAEGLTGNKNLEISYRTTKEGYEYYSILDNEAKKEFKFGQAQSTPGFFFPKGWEDAYQPDANAAAPQVGVQAQPATQGFQPPAQQVPQPVQQVQPPIQQQVQQPIQQVQQPVQQPIQQQVQQPVQQPVPAQVAQGVNDTLAKYGLPGTPAAPNG